MFLPPIFAINLSYCHTIVFLTYHGVIDVVHMYVPQLGDTKLSATATSNGVLWLWHLSTDEINE